MNQPIFPMFPKGGASPTLAMVHCYDEETDIGTFHRSGREVGVSISLQGWWCEGLHFGYMYFQSNYTAQFELEGMTQEDAEKFVRELTSVIPDEMASGVDFVFAPRSGPFNTAIINYGNAHAKALADTIERYNAPPASGTPDDAIANLGVQA